MIYIFFWMVQFSNFVFLWLVTGLIDLTLATSFGKRDHPSDLYSETKTNEMKSFQIKAYQEHQYQFLVPMCRIGTLGFLLHTVDLS